LAYLHEKRFSPNPRVLDKYGLKPGSYILVRLSSLEAHHDKGQSGVPEELIDYLRANSRDKQILESRELSTNYSFDPWDMQQLLGFSSFLISDSQTMSIEAAILGTPSIRVSSFKETLTAPIEIEKIAHHAYSFFPEETPAIVRKIDELLLAPPSMAARSASRNAILKRKIDLTDWMIEELPWNEEDAAS
jgi:predicted glycosyltransferase